MTKIYTKSGDKGYTGLVSGERVLKSETRIDNYGDIDELNSHIGVITSKLDKTEFTREYKILILIQNNLFNLGSNLACNEESRLKFNLPQIKNETIQTLEAEIDFMDSKLPALKKFILPGGSEVGAYLHVARTVCRRVERKLVNFRESSHENLPEYTIEFINRLSDYLFILSRYVNFKMKTEEINWESKN